MHSAAAFTASIQHRHLRAADPGFDPRGVLVLPIFLDTQAYSTGERVRTYYATLFDRLNEHLVAASC